MEMQIWKFSILKKKIYKYENKVNKLETINVSLLSFIMKHTKKLPVLNFYDHEALNQNRINMKKKKLYTLCFKAKPSASLIPV